MNDPTRIKAEVSSQMPPMDTTREALWAEIRDSRRADERTNPRLEQWYADWDAWREQEGHGGIMSLPEAYALGRGAGVAEVNQEIKGANAVLDIWRAPTTIHNTYSGNDEPVSLAGRIQMLLNPRNDESMALIQLVELLERAERAEAGAAEVERRYGALVEAARRVYEWGTADSVYEREMGIDEKIEDMNGDGYFAALRAALASIDGAP